MISLLCTVRTITHFGISGWSIYVTLFPSNPEFITETYTFMFVARARVCVFIKRQHRDPCGAGMFGVLTVVMGTQTCAGDKV